jgi:hypothetical protein
MGAQRPRTWIALALALEDKELSLDRRMSILRFLLPEGRDALIPVLRRLARECPERGLERQRVDRLLATWDPESPQRKSALEALNKGGRDAFLALRFNLEPRLDAVFIRHLLPLLDDRSKLERVNHRMCDLAGHRIAVALGKDSPVKVFSIKVSDDIYHLHTDEELAQLKAAAEKLLAAEKDKGGTETKP